MTYGIYVPTSVGKKMGLEKGDKIVAVGGKPVDDFDRISSDIILWHGSKSIEVDRSAGTGNQYGHPAA